MPLGNFEKYKIQPSEQEFITYPGTTTTRISLPGIFSKSTQEKTMTALEEADKKDKELGAKAKIPTLFDIIGPINEEAVKASQTVPGLLDRAKSFKGQISDFPAVAGAKALSAKTPFIEAYIGQEYQPIISNNGLLTQTLTKMYQGARPSEMDQKINERMVDATGKGKGTYVSALDEVDRHFRSRKIDVFDAISTGCREKLNPNMVRDLGTLMKIPTKTVDNKIKDLYSPKRTWEYIPEETQEATTVNPVTGIGKEIKLPGGKTFIIKGR